jgi:DNA-directed RNA polymerase I and III subunit RPAC2
MASLAPQSTAPEHAEEEPPRVEIEAGSDTSAATFTLHNEDHTIGNSLRYVLNKDPQVSFVGYSVPHPSEPKMNLRIQTVGPWATSALHGALGTLYEITAHTKDTFDQAVADFRARQAADG